MKESFTGLLLLDRATPIKLKEENEMNLPMLKPYAAITLVSLAVFAAGALYSRPYTVAPNAVLYLGSDTGEYYLVLEAELVVVTESGGREVRYAKGDVLPSVEDLLKGHSLIYEDTLGDPHRFDGSEARRKIQEGLRKALFGM